MYMHMSQIDRFHSPASVLWPNGEEALKANTHVERWLISYQDILYYIILCYFYQVGNVMASGQVSAPNSWQKQRSSDGKVEDFWAPVRTWPLFSHASISPSFSLKWLTSVLKGSSTEKRLLKKKEGKRMAIYFISSLTLGKLFNLSDPDFLVCNMGLTILSTPQSYY